MTGAKPLYRFRDRALAGLMAARGWKGEWPFRMRQAQHARLFADLVSNGTLHQYRRLIAKESAGEDRVQLSCDDSARDVERLRQRGKLATATRGRGSHPLSIAVREPEAHRRTRFQRGAQPSGSIRTPQCRVDRR